MWPRLSTCAQAGVALVGGDDLALVAGAGEDELGELLGVEPLERAHPLPELAAGQQAGLEHLDEAGRQLLRRQGGERRRVGEHRGRQVVGAGVVLALRQVDPGLAAVGGVDLGDQRGRHLDDRHAALVEVGAEAGEVADDAAAERDDVVLARHPGRASSRSTRSASAIVFAASPGCDLDPRGQRLEAIGVERADGGCR